MFVFLLISLQTYSQTLNHVNICTALCTTCCIFSAHIDSQLSQVYSHTIFIFFEYMNFLKTIHEEEFRNVNLSNLGNVLQRTFRTNRVRECIFRKSGGTNFEKSSARRQP